MERTPLQTKIQEKSKELSILSKEEDIVKLGIKHKEDETRLKEELKELKK